MHIWIDGDSCPKPIKYILFRAAVQRKINVTMVSNHLATVPASVFIKRIVVESGFDVADRFIVNHVEKNDLVITSDIILADLVIDKGAMALNSKGVLFSPNNIKYMLTMRNVNESLRSSGMIPNGPAPLSPKDIQMFSNHLDKMITQYHRIA